MSINYLESILAVSESQVRALDTTKLVNKSLAELLTDRLPIAFLDISPIHNSVFVHNSNIFNAKDIDEDEGIAEGSDSDDFDDDFDDDDFDDDDFDDDDFDDEDFDDSDFYEDDFDDDDIDDDFENDADADEEGSLNCK